MRALHFGAGNIGRGFVGVLLHEAGYELVFADVDAQLIAALNAQDRYTVHEVGAQPRDVDVTGFSGVDSARDPQGLLEEIAQADVITTAVGPTVLGIIAPTIAQGLALRAERGRPPVAVMACENAINATDGLARSIREAFPQADEVAIFANTAVDRIVPQQSGDAGLDVTVESYHEWAVESGPFGQDVPEIPGITWVKDLAPYITRKLYTVNTGHAAAAYFGHLAGIEKISDVLDDERAGAAVAQVLDETKQVLVETFGFSPQEQQAYVDTILTRFANPHLPDTVTRVGRAPLRKISRQERFVGPAAQLVELGGQPRALVEAVGAALAFAVPEDPEAVQLQEQLRAAKGSEQDIRALVTQCTGIAPDHGLYQPLLEQFTQAVQAV